VRAPGLCLLAVVGALLAAASPAGADTLRFFHSPSGNIDCLVSEGYARCDIRAHTFKAPKRPAACDLEWGSVLSVGKANRRGGFACVGDTVRDPSARALPYGRSIVVGRVRCTSRADGIRCRNRFGRGFLLGRTAYRLF
jgi:hypothetical protein